MGNGSIEKVGARLRKVPGLARVLDLRMSLVRRRWDRHARRDAEARWSDLASRGNLRLNVGSGPEHLDGWVNADILGDPAHKTMILDATKPWPLPDACAEAVNSEHFLEHIDPGAAGFYFGEAFRVLQPGGVIRTSTPDLEGLSKAYLAADPKLLDLHHSHGYEARNHADMLNNYVYSWEHRHIYDFETIKLLLHQAGFEEVERVEFGNSRHQPLDGVDRHDVGALASTVVGVDAVKPANPAAG
jgi:predicted SAM-dependent methyltransferase